MKLNIEAITILPVYWKLHNFLGYVFPSFCDGSVVSEVVPSSRTKNNFVLEQIHIKFHQLNSGH